MRYQFQLQQVGFIRIVVIGDDITVVLIVVLTDGRNGNLQVELLFRFKCVPRNGLGILIFLLSGVILVMRSIISIKCSIGLQNRPLARCPSSKHPFHHGAQHNRSVGEVGEEVVLGAERRWFCCEVAQARPSPTGRQIRLYSDYHSDSCV